MLYLVRAFCTILACEMASLLFSDNTAGIIASPTKTATIRPVIIPHRGI